MTNYQDLDWNSLNFVKNHLYRRLANPLNHALGRLLIMEHIVTDVHARQQFQQVTRNLEVALNLVKAWTALVHVQSGGRLTPGQRRYLGTDKLPAWIVEHLKLQTDVQLIFKRRIYAHPETFYEALVLMLQIAAAIGSPQVLRLEDAPDSGGVWARAVFDAPAGEPYAGLSGLAQRLDLKEPGTRDILTQILVLRALLALNGAELRMQTNEQTGTQALAVRMPTSSSEQIIVAPELPQAMLDALDATSSDPARPQAVAPEPERPIDKSETLIIPPPGFRKRLAKITAAAQAAAHEQADPAQDDASTSAATPAALTVPSIPAIENESDTLMLPPSDREQRLAEAQYAAGSLPPQPADAAAVENQSETLMLPPTDRETRLAETAQAATDPTAAPAAPESGTPEIENRSETLMLAPADREERLAEAAQAALEPLTEPATEPAADTSSDFIERVIMGDDDTQTVPPPDLHTELLRLRNLSEQLPAASPFPETKASDAADTANASDTDPAVPNAATAQESLLGIDERMVAVNITIERYTTPEPDADSAAPAPDTANESDAAAHTVENKSETLLTPPGEVAAHHQPDRAIAEMDVEGTDDAPGASPDHDHGPDAPSDTSAPNAHTNG